MSFRDETVVITGAAGGIGSALARRFAREGARLALLDRDGADTQALAKEVEALGASALPVTCDVTSLPDCVAAVDSVIGAFGGVDVLVNNAGIISPGLVPGDRRRGRSPRDGSQLHGLGALHEGGAGVPPRAPGAHRRHLERRRRGTPGDPYRLRCEQARPARLLRVVARRTPQGRTAGHARLSLLRGHRDRRPRSGARAGDLLPPRRAPACDRRCRQRTSRTRSSVPPPRDRRLLLVGREATLSWWIARFAPALYERLMIRRTLT